MPKKPGPYYNRTNTCDRCKIEKLKPHKAYREYVIKDKKEVWTVNNSNNSSLFFSWGTNLVGN